MGWVGRGVSKYRVNGSIKHVLAIFWDNFRKIRKLSDEIVNRSLHNSSYTRTSLSGDLFLPRLGLVLFWCPFADQRDSNSNSSREIEQVRRQLTDGIEGTRKGGNTKSRLRTEHEQRQAAGP
jgi:hypothetical protein